MRPRGRALVLVASLACLAIAATASRGATPTPSLGDPGTPPFPIWPLPQESRYADDRLLLGEGVIVAPAGDARAQAPARLLAELLADQFGVAMEVVSGPPPAGRTPIVVGEVSNAAVAAAVAARSGASVPEQAEGYFLQVDDAGVVVAGRDARGALYGVSSLAQL